MTPSRDPRLRSVIAGELDYLTITQFVALHAGCLLLFWVGFSWIAIATCVAFYCLRIFAVSAGYHRYFCELFVMKTMSLPETGSEERVEESVTLKRSFCFSATTREGIKPNAAIKSSKKLPDL